MTTITRRGVRRTMMTTTTTTPTTSTTAMVMRYWSVALLLRLVSAERDSNYYPTGLSNPNTRNKMYWRDASNVLEDLSQFSKLYVSYQNCAWSPYGKDDEQNPCGLEKGGDDDSLWYMGYTECFRANAAYSLYGVLKGDDEHRGCTRKTFINSFFTTYGVEDFTQAMQAAGVSFSSSYNNNGEEDEYPGGVTSACENSENTSYGLTCSATKSFVMKTFTGQNCDYKRAVSADNALRTFNDDLSNALCIPIYDDSSSSNYNNNEEEQNGGNQEYKPLDLLQYSRSCDVGEFPKQCPDPHGSLHLYSNAVARSTTKFLHPRVEGVKGFFSWLFLLLGVVLLLGAMSLKLRKVNKDHKNNGTDEKSRKSWSSWRSKRSNKSGQNVVDDSNKSSLGNSNDTKNEKRKPFWKRMAGWRRKE